MTIALNILCSSRKTLAPNRSVLFLNLIYVNFVLAQLFHFVYRSETSRKLVPELNRIDTVIGAFTLVVHIVN